MPSVYVYTLYMCILKYVRTFIYPEYYAIVLLCRWELCRLALRVQIIYVYIYIYTHLPKALVDLEARRKADEAASAAWAAKERGLFGYVNENNNVYIYICIYI